MCMSDAYTQLFWEMNHYGLHINIENSINLTIVRLVRTYFEPLLHCKPPSIIPSEQCLPIKSIRSFNLISCLISISMI
jgi:hypothetical protein